MLYKIRNPWGSDDVFNGALYDGSFLWTYSAQTYAAQVGFVKNFNDGILFIEAKEFNSNFAFFGINYYNENYYSSALPLTNTSNTTYYRFDFNNSISQDGFIGLDLYDQRMYPTSCNKPYTYVQVWIYLNGKSLTYAKLNDNNWKGFANVH